MWDEMLGSMTLAEPFFLPEAPHLTRPPAPALGGGCSPAPAARLGGTGSRWFFQARGGSARRDLGPRYAEKHVLLSGGEGREGTV